MEKIKENTEAFLVIWLIVLILNQAVIFGGCFKIYCLLAALPHTGFIAFLIVAFSKEQPMEKNTHAKPSNTYIKPNDLQTSQYKSHEDLMNLLGHVHDEDDELSSESKNQVFDLNSDKKQTAHQNDAKPIDKSVNIQESEKQKLQLELNALETQNRPVKKFTIQELPFNQGKPFKIQINKIDDVMITFMVGESSYLIAKPKNDTWKNIVINQNDVCTVEKVQNGNGMRLNLIDVNDKSTTSKETKTVIYENLKTKYQEDLAIYNDTAETLKELKTTLMELNDAIALIGEENEEYEEFSSQLHELTDEAVNIEQDMAKQEVDLTKTKRSIDEYESSMTNINETQPVSKKPSNVTKSTVIKMSAESTPYTSHIQSIDVPNFEKIRRYCNNLSDDNNADPLQTYLAENGKMYKAIIYDALEQFISQLDGKEINLFDWGCGQGIASMLVLDYIREKQLAIKIKNIKLIDDDAKVLSRAMAQVEALKQPSMTIEAIDSKSANAHVNIPSDNKPNLHLFANDKIPLDLSKVDFAQGFTVCLSHQNTQTIDKVCKALRGRELSNRDGKIGRFQRFERIIKLNS